MTTLAIGPDLRIQTSRSRRYLVPPRVVGVLLLSAALGLGRVRVGISSHRVSSASCFCPKHSGWE